MAEINKKQVSYLGFDWVNEVKNAILDYLDNLLEQDDELPMNCSELIEDLNRYYGFTNVPEVCSLADQDIYEAVVSNMNLVTIMLDDYGMTLGNELGDNTLWQSAAGIGTYLQEYLFNQFVNFTDDEYLNLTSSINKQAQIEALQQAVIHNAEKFKAEHKEDLTPTIENPLDLKAPAREALIAGLEERGYINNSQNKSFLADKKIPSLNERANSARSVSEAQQKNHISQVRTFDRERG